MILSLSTRWNTYRHSSGEALVEEIIGLGLRHIELGYDLTMDLVPGIEHMVNQGAVTVTSVHNFCPVPIGAFQGHPELFLLGSTDPRERRMAIDHTIKTVNFASHVGAKAVVVHAGRVRMRHLTRKLIALQESGKQYSSKYERVKMKLLAARDKKVPKYFDALCESLEELVPALEAAQVKVGLENLPSWEAVPTEVEMESLLARFGSPWIGYWHDFGHAQIRQNLGLINHKYWLERLAGAAAGVHVHDCDPPARDHLMPGLGAIDFAGLLPLLPAETALVLEPAPGTPHADVENGIRVIRDALRQEAAPVEP
jgi:sugar phosphate isomerase/epimerase